MTTNNDNKRQQRQQTNDNSNNNDNDGTCILSYLKTISSFKTYALHVTIIVVVVKDNSASCDSAGSSDVPLITGSRICTMPCST